LAAPNAAGAEGAALPGTIAHREFLGSSVRYSVVVGGTEVSVDQPFHSGEELREVGEAVALALTPRSALWLAG
jgi:iron(III) transport system ATP-binding protein